MGTVIDDRHIRERLLGQHSRCQTWFQQSTKRASIHSTGVLKSVAAAFQAPTHKTYLAIAIISGVLCGIVAFIYSATLQGTLSAVWKQAPQRLVLPFLLDLQRRWPTFDPGRVAWVFTVATATAMGTAAGAVQSLMGSPGDLPETVDMIHEKVRPTGSRDSHDAFAENGVYLALLYEFGDLPISYCDQNPPPLRLHQG